MAEPPSAPGLSLVTLGVRDVAVATRFYESLGWRRSSASNASVTFLHGATVLALWGRDDLAQDANMPANAAGFSGIALARNVPARDDVDAFLARAQKAGARIQKPAQDTFWGGRSGYFRDPDGHLWEVAWNPAWPLKADGTVTLPP